MHEGAVSSEKRELLGLVVPTLVDRAHDVARDAAAGLGRAFFYAVIRATNSRKIVGMRAQSCGQAALGFHLRTQEPLNGPMDHNRTIPRHKPNDFNALTL